MHVTQALSSTKAAIWTSVQTPRGTKPLKSWGDWLLYANNTPVRGTNHEAAAAPVSVPPAAAAAAVTAAVVVRRAARGTARTPVWLAASQRRAGGGADEPRARFRRKASVEPAARDRRGAARKRGRRRRGRGGRARISTSGARASLGLPRRAARSRRHGPQHRPTPSCTAPDVIHTMPRRPATAAWRRRAAGARVRRRR